jgi:hypothetical protein
MSGWGQSRRFDRRQITSGLPPEADIFGVGRYVSKVPPDPDVRPINLDALIDSKEISARFEPETVPLAEGRLNGFFNPVFPG